MYILQNFIWSKINTLPLFVLSAIISITYTQFSFFIWSKNNLAKPKWKILIK